MLRIAKSDKKQYLLKTLASNGLEVLLISDPNSSPDSSSDSSSFHSSEHSSENSKKDENSTISSDSSGSEAPGGPGMCAVALAVQVGSMDELPGDPKGVAHLLEHMLFMGSKKFPKENEYDAFLSKNGGFSNAFTESEHTVYYFECPPEALHHAMDVFAQFFINPLMNNDSLKREIHAVDSEFDLSRLDDDARMTELWKTGCVDASHPYARFAWGNSKTLVGDKLRNQLVGFYEKHYTVDKMKLVVWSTENIEELEGKVEEIFSAIPKVVKPGVVTEKPIVAVLPFSSKTCLNFVHRIVPVTDRHVLRMTWQHTPLVSYKSRPAAYVAHLLGHESQGSALQYLKKHGLGTELYAGTSEDDGMENSTICSMFCLEVKLSEQGARVWDRVAYVIFAYLGMLREKGPQKWIFDEVATTSELAFEYKDDGEPSNEACDLAVNMLPKSKIDRNNLLCADHLLFDFVDADMNALMANLGCTGEHAPRYDLCSSLFGRESDFAMNSILDGSSSNASASSMDIPGELLVEEYCGTRYWKQKLPLELETKFTHALSNAKVALEMQLDLPPRNEFIPTNLKLFDLDAKVVERRAQHPLVGAKVEVSSKSGKRVAWFAGSVKRSKLSSEDQSTDLFIEYDGGETVWFSLKPEAATAATTAAPAAAAATTSNIWCPLEGAAIVESKTDPFMKLRVIQPSLPLGPICTLQNNAKFWHMQDFIFRVPRSGMYVGLRLPQMNRSAKNRFVGDLVTTVAGHLLDHDVYLAKMAEINLNIKTEDEGIVISAFGLSEKVCEIVSRTLVVLLNLLKFSHVGAKSLEKPDVKQITAIEHEALLRSYDNAETAPETQANMLRLRAIVPGMFSKVELAKAGINAKTSDESLLKNSALEVFHHGNVNDKDALETRKRILSEFKQAGVSIVPMDPRRPEVVQIPILNRAMFLTASHESSEVNCAIQLYFQLGMDTPASQALGELLEHVMEEPLFDELRTKQQLAYSLGCGLRRTHGVLGFSIEITSSKFGPNELLSRVEAFLVQFRKELVEEIDDFYVTSRSKSLAKRLLQKDSGIFQETKRHWVPIYEKTYLFNEKYLIVHELLRAPKSKGRFGVTSQELLRFFDESFEGKSRRSLAVCVVGSGCTVTSLGEERIKAESGGCRVMAAEDAPVFWSLHPGRFNMVEQGNDQVMSKSRSSSRSTAKSSSKKP